MFAKRTAGDGGTKTLTHPHRPSATRSGPFPRSRTGEGFCLQRLFHRAGDFGVEGVGAGAEGGEGFAVLADQDLVEIPDGDGRVAELVLGPGVERVAGVVLDVDL